MTASAPLDLSGFTFPMVAPTDTIDSVTAAVNGWVSDLAMGPLAYELHDGISGALLGSAAGTAMAAARHTLTRLSSGRRPGRSCTGCTCGSPPAAAPHRPARSRRWTTSPCR